MVRRNWFHPIDLTILLCFSQDKTCHSPQVLFRRLGCERSRQIVIQSTDLLIHVKKPFWSISPRGLRLAVRSCNFGNNFDNECAELSRYQKNWTLEIVWAYHTCFVGSVGAHRGNDILSKVFRPGVDYCIFHDLAKLVRDDPSSYKNFEHWTFQSSLEEHFC